MTPTRDHVEVATRTPTSVTHTRASTRRRVCPRDTIDLCVIGAGPTATMLALSAQERGMSVALLEGGGGTLWQGPWTGVVGHGHPHGYRWLARRHGGRAACRFAALATSGRQQLWHLMTSYAIPCNPRAVSWRLGTLHDDPRSLQAELDAMVDVGLPVRAAADRGAPTPFALSRHRLPDDLVIDEDSFVRGATEAAEGRGVTIDASPVCATRRLPGLRGAWSVTTEDARYVTRHVVQTGPALSDHTGVRARSIGANVLLIDTGDVAAEGRYSFHARRPVEVLVRDHRPLGYRQLVVSRFGGRPATDAGFEAWAARSWSDGLLRDRWWAEAPIHKGFPVYGQVGRSRRWFLGGLELWGLAVQSHVAARVTAAVHADLSGVRVRRPLAWPQPAPIAARPASG